MILTRSTKCQHLSSCQWHVLTILSNLNQNIWAPPTVLFRNWHWWQKYCQYLVNNVISVRICQRVDSNFWRMKRPVGQVCDLSVVTHSVGSMNLCLLFVRCPRKPIENISQPTLFLDSGKIYSISIFRLKVEKRAICEVIRISVN